MSEVCNLDYRITCHAWNKERSLLAYSPDNHEVLICKKVGSEWQMVDNLAQHDLRVTGVDWAPNTNRIVTCSMDRNAYVWTQGADGKWNPELVLLRINRAATCVKWSPQENKFAVGSGARCIAVCYFESEHKWWVSKHIKKPIRSTIMTLDWHPNNVLLAAGATDYRVRVFSSYLKEVDKPPVATAWGEKMPFGQLLAEMKNSPSGGGWVLDVNFSADGSKLCWVGRDSSVNVAVAGATPTVIKLKTDILPFERCVWIAPNQILCVGYSLIPTVYQFNNSNISLYAQLDRQDNKVDPKAFSARKIFENLDDTAQAGNNRTLPTIHQSSIKCLSLFKGDKAKAVKVCTSALDRQLVIWDLAKMQAMKK